MIQSKTQLQQMQNAELDIFKVFIEMCEKLHLNYYVMGGTLLGAVRHKGFIPWDDDIDVGMLRDEYEIFMREAGSLLPPHLFLQNHRTEREFHSNAAKLRNSNTTFIETGIKNAKINHGIFIDIFPLDYYPDTSMKELWLKIRKKVISARINMVFEREHPENAVKRLLKAPLKILYPTISKAVKKMESVYMSCPVSSKIANHNGAWEEKEIVPVQWYAQGCELQFEGITVRGPKEYDKWLTQVYGDYMQLPPVEKRVTHHHTEVIDLERPYTEYMDKE